MNKIRKTDMNILNERLKTVTGYLINITRDCGNGWYFIEVAVPASWEIGDNDDIECDVLNENDKGKMVKIAPKNNTVVVDDLLLFAEVIIETNIEIEKKEKEFEEKIMDMKKQLEMQAKDFYTKLDEHKKTSFKNLKRGIEEISGSNAKAAPTKRGRPAKNIETDNNSDNNKTTETAQGIDVTSKTEQVDNQ